ncbi:YncE family protein [Mycobacterium genavense]|uniref:YncE family protein n=1 Tax=Mycobacterium genavense TaxID=36812 RepID=UPI00046F93E6|nr:YncE family protein [Mycobacterium genavense]
MSETNGREAAGGVVEIDATPMAPMAIEIAVGNGPISGIATSPDGRRLVATHYGTDRISIIDTDTFRVVDTIDGVDEPFAIATAGSGPGRAYVSTVSTAYDAIWVIDVSTNAVVATHPLTLSVSDLAVDTAGRQVYAGRDGAWVADLAALDTATGKIHAITIAEAAATECVRVSPDGSRAYVGVNGPTGGRLVVVDTRAQAGARASWRQKRGTGERTALRVIDTVEIGLPVRDVALSRNGAIAYVASCAPEVGVVVDVIDTRTNKIITTRKVGEIGGFLTGMTLSAGGARAYLVSDHNVTVLGTLTHDVIATLAAGMQPSCALESPDGKRLYIAGYCGAVSVTPIATPAPPAIESGADRELPSTALLVPDLVAHEPVLA